MSDNINVAVRLRCRIPREITDGSKVQWVVKDNSITNVDPDSKKHLSSYVFGKIFLINRSVYLKLNFIETIIDIDTLFLWNPKN